MKRWPLILIVTAATYTIPVFANDASLNEQCRAQAVNDNIPEDHLDEFMKSCVRTRTMIKNQEENDGGIGNRQGVDRRGHEPVDPSSHPDANSNSLGNTAPRAPDDTRQR